MMKWYIWNESHLNCGYEIKWSYDLRSYERNFCNCVEKSEKFRTSTGFEPVTSRFRCDALSYEATDVGSSSFVGSNGPVRNESMMKWYIWNESHMNCGYEIKLSWLERRTGIARSRVQTPLKSWIFQTSLRNCKNCAHNCEDHSFTWFHIRSSYVIHFIYTISSLIHSSRDH